jgi:hypothetical protein
MNPVPRLLAVCALLAVTSCAQPLTLEDTHSDIQALYARQDQGYAAISVDDACYHVRPSAQLTSVAGSPVSGAQARSVLQTLFSSASNLHSQSTVLAVDLNARQATVDVSRSLTYTAPAAGSKGPPTPEPFEQDVTTRDTWVHAKDGWWLTKSENLGVSIQRNGVAISPTN